MDHKEAISDFIDLYLSIDLPKKDIDLVKLKSLQEPRTSDPLEQCISSFRKAIQLCKKHYGKHRTRSHYGLPEKLENIIHLTPEDFFIVLSRSRYGFKNEVISLILQAPEETIHFREKHIKSSINTNEAELKNIHHELRALERKTFSQIQKLKGKLKPQKFILESILTMIAVIIVLWSIPVIKKRYDLWALKKTSEYFVSDSIKTAPIPPELNTEPKIINQEEVSLPEELSATTKTERKQPKAIDGEVWRFSFTGSSKVDLEKELKKIIEKYSSQPTKSSIAPGGIQFDTFIKTNELIEMKMAFEQLTDSQNKTLKMSWYKKKNMGTKKIPSAHVEVVIWISTI